MVKHPKPVKVARKSSAREKHRAPLQALGSRDFTTSVVFSAPAKAFRNPLLLVGLPGIGFVSKLAADHLVKLLDAERVATLYSPHLPNQTIALRSGRLKLFSLKVHAARLRSRDLLIVRGDLQPLTVEGQYEVSARLLDYYRRLGGRDVIALAGYAVNRHAEKPAVYVSATNQEWFERLQKLGAKPVPQPIPIIGLAGLVPGLAKLYGARGACLLVETPGAAIDAKGAAALLDVVGALVGEKFDAKSLHARAEKAQAAMRKLEEQQGAAGAQPQGVAGAVEKPPRETLRYIT